ncbi:MAG: histidine kinase [Flavobacteriales bacterium]
MSAHDLAAQGVDQAEQQLVDSMLALPYDQLVADLTRSNKSLHRALAIAERNKDAAAIGELRTDLATVNFLLGQYDSSAFYGLGAVRILEANGLWTLQGEALTRLAFQIKGTDREESFRYFRKGLALLEREDARYQLCGAYDNFGVVHEENGNRDSALFYYRKALALKESLNDSIGIPYSLNKIGTALFPERRFEEALALFQRADTIRRAIGDRMGMADQLVYFGDLYEAWGRPEQAVPYFKIGVEQGRALDFPFLVRYSYEHLAQCYEAMGDHEAALHAFRTAVALKDSVVNEQTTRTIVELKEQYNAAEKDREIAEMEERDARRRLYTWIIAIAVGLVVVSVLLVQQMRRRAERAERDALIIHEREAGLKAMFEATENERGRLARELHDGVGQQLGGLKHRLESLKERVRPEEASTTLLDAIGIVDDTSKEVRDLAHQMMPKALVRLGLVPAMEEMVRKAFEGTGTHYAFEHHRVPEDLRPEIATGLYRIAQELINNIIKHAMASKVDVQLMRNRDMLVLMVEDDGKGLAEDEGSGIGLLSITDRARALGGTFALDPAGATGALATVRIPLGPTESA